MPLSHACQTIPTALELISQSCCSSVFPLLAGFEMPGKFHGRPSVQFSLTYIDWQKDVVQCKLKIECFLAWTLLSQHSWQRKGRTLTFLSFIFFFFLSPLVFQWLKTERHSAVCLLDCLRQRFRGQRWKHKDNGWSCICLWSWLLEAC